MPRTMTHVAPTKLEHDPAFFAHWHMRCVGSLPIDRGRRRGGGFESSLPPTDCSPPIPGVQLQLRQSKEVNLPKTILQIIWCVVELVGATC